MNDEAPKGKPVERDRSRFMHFTNQRVEIKPGYVAPLRIVPLRLLMKRGGGD